MPVLVRSLSCVWLAALIAGFAVRANPEPPSSNYNPKLAQASDEAVKAISRFKLDSKLSVSVWASEPMLAHPVAFCFDEKGRCYVAETFRHSRGVTDNRSHMYWLEDELAARTVADRVAVYRKYAKGKFPETYEKERERIRLLEDTKGTGQADRSTVFSDRFGRAEDGIGAGVLARNGSVYFTCIPDLWLLKDSKGTGKADVQESLSTGYGVHVAFIGHDLHGLRIGPDGKLYFSIGDRGLNVKTKEGKHLFYPDTGAVLRCDLDGANLEVVHSGLRNPQELAFDDHGNLFTVDNNSDSGDQARWVYIVEGADSGWRLGYQYGSEMHDKTVKQGNRGPWNYEQLWVPGFNGQAAYILPPLLNFSAGPSGFCYYPGVGLSERYQGHFFLADFRGGSSGSGIWSFAAKPKGASFEMVDSHQFMWSILATDCDFGPDSNFYVLDWVEGWNLNGKGRIYKVSDTAEQKKPVVAEVKKLLGEGFTQRSTEELTKLLEHPHQQIRTEAQFALVLRAGNNPVREIFAKVAAANTNMLAKLHGVWGLGMIVRQDEKASGVLMDLAKNSTDAEVRAQAAKVLGNVQSDAVRAALTERLTDAEPRVQFFAALSLAKQKPSEASTKALLTLARENNNKDLYLRHAIVMGLTGSANEQLLLAQVNEPSPAARMTAVLALRKMKLASVSAFLNDPDPLIVAEAARAIHDEDLSTGLSKLAALTANISAPVTALYRALNAHYRLGQTENANAVAEFAARVDAPESLRILAVKMLGSWANPSRRDYITGLTQNLGTRNPSIAANAFQSRIGRLFSGPATLQKEAASVAGKLGIKEVGPVLLGLVQDRQGSASTRIEAIRALDSLKAKQLDEALTIALSSSEPRLRNAARTIRARTQPKEVLGQIKDVLGGKDIVEQQGALAILADIPGSDADALIEDWLEKLIKKDVAPELQLDVILAASKRPSERLKRRLASYEQARPKGDDLAAYRETLLGGDAENGRRIFLNNATVQCQRCHKLDGEGGEVGPVMNGIAAKQKRDYLLESIVLPNKQIAKGFESVRLTLANGKTIEGVLRAEDDKTIRIVTPEGQTLTIPKADVDERRASKSAMPEDLAQKLSKSEIRDLVEFLSTLKEEPKK